MTEMYTGMDFQSEFRNYAIKHMGVSGMQFFVWEKLQASIYNNVMVPSAYQTPYILEEREMRVTQMDIFSRLMMDRILWLAGPVHDQMSTIISAQVLFMGNLDPDKDITMYVDSPGGSVKSGLTIVDTMNLAGPDIKTINTGMAASMGSILLGAGTKGKRSALPNSKVMLHQVSLGASGNIQDVKINIDEGDKANDILFNYLGEYCGKTATQVKKDAARDLWLTASEALTYGIIDEIITKKTD